MIRVPRKDRRPPTFPVEFTRHPGKLVCFCWLNVICNCCNWLSNCFLCFVLVAANFLRAPIQESDWWESADESSEVDDDSVAEARPEQQPPKRPKKFCNRGYETWIQGRQAWKECVSDPSPRKNYKIVIPESFKAQLVKCLSDRRHFELSQRIPLSEMINAYQDVWNKPNE